MLEMIWLNLNAYINYLLYKNILVSIYYLY